MVKPNATNNNHTALSKQVPIDKSNFQRSKFGSSLSKETPL